MFFSFFLFRAPTDEQTPNTSSPLKVTLSRVLSGAAAIEHTVREFPTNLTFWVALGFVGSWAASETNLGSWFCGWMDFVAGRMREQADWRFCGIGWRNVSSLKFGSRVKEDPLSIAPTNLFGSSRCLWWRRRWWWWFESNFILGYHYYCVKDYFSFTTTARMDGCLPEAMIPLWKKTWVSADHDSSPRLLRSVREKRETEAPQIKFQFVTERCVYGDWLVSIKTHFNFIKRRHMCTPFLRLCCSKHLSDSRAWDCEVRGFEFIERRGNRAILEFSIWRLISSAGW